MPIGKYNTKQKECILNFMIENKGKHNTVLDVYDFLRKNNQNIGTTTIYRNLKLLEDEGLIIKYNLVEGTATCYEYIDTEKKCACNYHFKCECCNELLHFQCEELNHIETHIHDKHNLSINKIKTVFYGTCGKCKNK